jgi:hypothetical protein
MLSTRNLSKLNLSHLPIACDQIKELIQYSLKLKHLALQMCRLNDTSVGLLDMITIAMSKLEILDIRSNQVGFKTGCFILKNVM